MPSSSSSAAAPSAASWAPEGGRTYLVTELGLDLTTVQAKSPKICIERDNEGMLWFDTIDGMGYLWTALYDSSGDCCPVSRTELPYLGSRAGGLRA